MALVPRAIPQFMQIAGKTVRTIEEAKQLLKSLTPQDLSKEIQRINKELLKRDDELNQMLIVWTQDIISDNDNFGLSGEDLVAFNNANAQIKERGKAALLGQLAIDKAKTTMMSSLGKLGTRATVFAQQMIEIQPPRSKNFYHSISALFKKNNDPVLSIRLLNNEILKHAAQKLRFETKGIRYIDIDNAKKVKPEDGDGQKTWDLKQLKASELREYGLTLSESGLLVEGQYNDEVFAVFGDEKEVEVTVESTAEPEDLVDKMPTTTSSAAGPSYEKDAESENFEVITPPLPATIPALDFAVPALPITPTPRRSDRAKRPAQESLASSTSPTKSVKSRRNSTPHKSRWLRPCTCSMSDEWKMNVELGIENGEVLSRRCLEILEPLSSAYLVGEQPGVLQICHPHVQDAGKLLGVNTSFLTIPETMERFAIIYDIIRDTDSLREAWIRPETQHFFHQTEKVVKFKKNRLNIGKYTQLPSPRKPIEASRVMPGPLVAPTEGRDGIWIFNDFFKWTEKAKTVFTQDLEMHLFHCREEACTEFGLVQSIYHSLWMQTVRQDPLLWRIIHDLRPDHATRMICVPSAARIFRPGNPIFNARFSGDWFDKEKSSVLSVEVFFTGSTQDVTYTKFTEESMINAVDSFPSPGFEWGNTDPEREAYANFSSQLEPEQQVSVSCTPFALHISEPGVVAVRECRNEGNQPMMSFSLVFLSVNDEGICENGIPASVYQRAHKTLSAPNEDQFGRPQIDMTCDLSLRLGGLSMVGDALVGQKELDDEEVVLEQSQWLKFENSSKDRYMLKNFREDAIKRAKHLAALIREKEMMRFEGPRSYFRVVQENLAVPAPDQPIFIDSDDSDEDVPDETPSKVPKLSGDFPVLSSPTESEDVVMEGLEALNSVGDYSGLE